MTPVLAAGFHEVADTYNVTVPQVALTTGLYMLGLGLGSVVASPTAILWGKRPGEHVDPAHLTLCTYNTQSTSLQLCSFAAHLSGVHFRPTVSCPLGI